MNPRYPLTVSFYVLCLVNLVAQSFVFAVSQDITGKVVAIVDGDTSRF